MIDTRNQYPLDKALNLGTVYPSNASWELFEESRQKLADKVNNGELGKVIRVYHNNRGVEKFFAPDLNATWTYDFA